LLVAAVTLAIVSCDKDDQKPNDYFDTPVTEVPDELAGAWEHGSIDFDLLENYRRGYYAGRNAAPSREAMIFSKNGKAIFYRYEFAFGLYEELIDCKGTVTFNNDGTFTFYPTNGRKCFYDTRHPENNANKPLTTVQLADPKLAGKRRYTHDGSSNPPVVQITVLGSAPYNWYKK
jgi:hypothetical protein